MIIVRAPPRELVVVLNVNSPTFAPSTARRAHRPADRRAISAAYATPSIFAASL